MAPVDPEVPEADAFEQSQEVGDDTELDDSEGAPGPETGSAPTRPGWKHQPSKGFEVPEADALDQEREVNLDEDRR